MKEVANKYSHSWKWLVLKPIFVIPLRLWGVLTITITPLFSIFIYNQVLARPNLQITALAMLDIQAGQRLLVVAPHPDDEILAAGGLMQNVLGNGGQVEVVIVTNGDGQFLSPLLDHPLSTPRAVNYVNFGKRRQDETLAAMEKIGIDPSQVIFLGYPDGRLGELWTKDWPDVAPAIAPYTRATSSPYQNTYNPQSSYRGGDLFNDLLAILINFQPDIIIVPHPEDTHSDHSTASDFTRFAIATYMSSDNQPNPKILAYLVHYMGYPVPRGDQAGRELLPPAALANQGEGWFTYSLSPE